VKLCPTTCENRDMLIVGFAVGAGVVLKVSRTVVPPGPVARRHRRFDRCAVGPRCLGQALAMGQAFVRRCRLRPAHLAGKGGLSRLYCRSCTGIAGPGRLSGTTATLGRRTHVCMADALSPSCPRLRAAPRCIGSDDFQRARLFVTAQDAFPVSY
jgi:hypothetical protein